MRRNRDTDSVVLLYLWETRGEQHTARGKQSKVNTRELNESQMSVCVCVCGGDDSGGWDCLGELWAGWGHWELYNMRDPKHAACGRSCLRHVHLMHSCGQKFTHSHHKHECKLTLGLSYFFVPGWTMVQHTDSRSRSTSLNSTQSTVYMQAHIQLHKHVL